MEKKLEKLLEYCRENHVEINISPEGIGIWTSNDDDLNLVIKDIHPSMVKSAVNNLRGMRVVGWKQN